MPVVIGPQEIKEFDVDAMAIRVFLKALEIIGGPRKLIEYRNLTWITSLMEASYAIVLAEEAFKTEDDIAEFLGLTRQTVRNILRAEPELVLKKLEGELQEKTPRAHTAGGLAKLAYKEIKEGRDALVFFSAVLQESARVLGVGWPAEILVRIKGLSWPADPEEVASRLAGLVVEGKALDALVREHEGPIEHPRVLLHYLAQKLKEA
ncbi:bacterio-opsin activator [Thermodesulfatator autotrophicus]|uniref:Bacterio-opsin activator n=1 Tax=Thermodesulfatator autotrophicus TaxID=1795632 RepID=A0A177E8V8_9BACT|nr:bacterio-opsin activator [Thermodesulfatator autotrophicus]OAG28345.1 bacterio-opsin activator [Thermodesulfatator autotrophicus]